MFDSTPGLLLLLLVSSTCASHFYGGTMTFNPKGTNPDGSYKVVLRYKLGFRSCYSHDTWGCASGDCGTQTSLVNGIVDQESGGEWCQREWVMTRNVSDNLPFELGLSGCCWILHFSWGLRTRVDLGVRSDTGKANRSPQITVIPLMRVAKNCPRNFTLLTHDQDGDQVKCRYAISALKECAHCTLPTQSIFTLDSTSCTLTVDPRYSNVYGAYAVQLVVEDYPTQSINLTYNKGSQSVRAASRNALSKLPVQFAVRVDAAVPSCTEGEYLPKFLPPTPDNGAQLYASVNQTLEITVSIQALFSVSIELLVSGPSNITTDNSTAPGEFTLSWTPSQDEEGETHPICFIAQARISSSAKLHSELRCVMATVANPTEYVVGLRIKLSSESPLTESYISSVVLQEFKEEMTSRGLAGDYTLRLKAVQKTSP